MISNNSFRHCIDTSNLGNPNSSILNEYGLNTHKNGQKHKRRIVVLHSKISKTLGIVVFLESAPSSRKIERRYLSTRDGVSVKNSSNTRLHVKIRSGGLINVTTGNSIISMPIVRTSFKLSAELKRFSIIRCLRVRDSPRGRDCSGNVNLDLRRV